MKEKIQNFYVSGLFRKINNFSVGGCLENCYNFRIFSVYLHR